MAAEEDKKFDAVLGGFLVNDVRIRAGNLHCPESDTLAAYHERSLLPEEMNLWKEHIVGCARCQAILGELEATDSIPLQVSEKEEVLTAVAATVVAEGRGSSLRKETPVKLPEKSRVRPISRGMRWQWLVPAGALAAGLLVWVALYENQSQLKAPTEIKTAKLEPAATPPAVTRDEREAVSSEELSRISKDQGALGRAAPGKPAREAKTLGQFEKPDARGRVASSVPHADKETGARTDTALDSLAARTRAQGKPAQDAKAEVPAAMSESAEVETLAANAQPQNQQAQQSLQAQKNQLNEQKSSGPNPSGLAEAAKKRKSESPVTGYRAAAAAPQPTPPPVMAYNDGAALQTAATFSPHLISAPDKKRLWRAGHMGMIEFSSDGGASWSRQVSNVSVELTAGSAPSERVCWIVGRAGTILLTTDAGSHWATIHSPLDEDVGGVRATDALHATIWNLGNTKFFETSDGGKTWNSAASQ